MRIEIEDDGSGIDAGQVGRRAQALGLTSADSAPDLAALLDLLCTPGFSTREHADLTSGRGVGMDIVRATVHELGGTLTLTTQPGHGTCFAIQLPLTLAIVDALIVGSAGQRFAVPLLAVREVIDLPSDVTALENNELLVHRGSAVPLLRLSRLFHLAAPAPDGTTLIIGAGAQAVGLAVDRILGKQEIVVRPIADPLAQVPGIAGASELGDGHAVLILDVGRLIQEARPRTRRPAPRPPPPPSLTHPTEELTMPESTPAAEPYILFELAGATYAVRSRDVRQLEMIDHLTPLPQAPAFVDGVVFSRGQVIPALNLRARFGFERIAYDTRARLLVIATAGRTVGLIVDTAREFVTIPADAIRPPPEAVAGLSGDYLEGIATLGDRLILMLDVRTVLDSGDDRLPVPATP